MLAALLGGLGPSAGLALTHLLHIWGSGFQQEVCYWAQCGSHTSDQCHPPNDLTGCIKITGRRGLSLTHSGTRSLPAVSLTGPARDLGRQGRDPDPHAVKCPEPGTQGTCIQGRCVQGGCQGFQGGKEQAGKVCACVQTCSWWWHLPSTRCHHLGP